MIPMSNASSYDRFRQAQAQRRSIARSNSSLLGSIKNFVAAPFARLFTGATNEFDDPNDVSGKRRIVPNQNVDNNDIVEDGPAPAKRMRVRSPEPHSTQRSSGYLDPPGSVFSVKHQETSFDKSPSRSASISLPSTTLPDSSLYNARSTISPLRNTFSRTMSIDHIPSNQSRPLTRDVSMKSLSSIPNLTTKTGSRDSMPPLQTHSFRLRDSSTPQPHYTLGRPADRDVSEPPPVTVLASNPVFVRGPSQAPESKTQPIPTLGSLVDSQRILRSPSRQRSLLFGSAQPAANPQAIAAERTFHELEFYKTPLVPTRIRSRMPSSFGASTSSTNITDMFARKHSLVLMGDHDRPTKRDKKNKGKRKSKSKETNDTKPYAGTTGIKKRLAKAKVPSQDEDRASVIEDEEKEVTVAPEIPVPPPKEKDTFSVVTYSSATSPAQQSSLRVGRAARSHLSRPIKKFSASFDDEDDTVSDEAKKDMEMLTEAAKKVPAFEIPAGFSFAKDVPPVEPVANAKEPPILALPFSLTSTSTTVSSLAQSTFKSVSDINLGPSSSIGLQLGTPISSDHASEIRHDTTGAGDAVGKVPNFFSASKTLASQPLPVSPPSSSVPTHAGSTSGLSSPFVFAPNPVVATKETPVSSPAQTSDEPGNKFSLSGAPSFTPPTSSFGQSSQPIFAPISTPMTDNTKKVEPQPSTPSFGAAPTQSTPSASQLPSFSFSKPTANIESAPSLAPSLPFSFVNSANAISAAAAEGTPKASPFSFGASPSGLTSSTNIFGSSIGSGDAKPSGISSLGASNETIKPTSSSPFGSNENSKPTSSSLFGSPGDNGKPTGSPFAFGQSSSENKADSSTTKFSFGPPPNTTEPDKSASAADNTTSSASPFSFAAPSTVTTEPPKSLFGGPPSTSDTSKTSGFAFGGSSSAPSTSAGISSTASTFTFGSGASTTNTASSPFTFGASPARPVTPPNQDREVRMDESPTRDTQVNKPTEPRPSLSGFSFGSAPSTSTSSSLFGQNSSAPVSGGFSFGQSSGASNPFGSNKAAESKPFGVSTSQGTSTFAFGRTPENEPPRPSTTGSFSFGTPGPSNAGTSSPFSFGAPPINTAPSNPFGAGQAGSNPSSPSTFAPSAPSSSFSFGATAGTGSSTGNPFSFGSQPASPATPNAGLPSSGFGAAPSNPFGAPAASNTGFGAPSAGVPSPGGSLFTIGAAPPDTSRQIKRLPNRKKR